jgi:hypothetical protein
MKPIGVEMKLIEQNVIDGFCFECEYGDLDYGN